MIKKKFIFNFDKKGLHGEGIFYGYASVFGVVDRQGIVVVHSI